MTFYLILAYSAFLLSLLGTRLLILAARNKVFIARDGRLAKPVPESGGIAVVMSLIICLLIADIDYGVVLAMFMLASISLLSDLIAVPKFIRLLVQLLAVLIPVGLLQQPLFGGIAPLWADKFLAAMLWVWFIEIFERLDGIDGLAPTQMISIATGFALIVAFCGGFPDALSVYSLIIMAAGCGFFWWNWAPAKIHLGEVGSVPIGYLLGYLLFIAAASGYGYAALILPAYYLCDGALTALRRAWRGKETDTPHFEHFYQLAVKSGRRHDSVVRYIFGVNVILIALAIFTVIDPGFAFFYALAAYMCVFIILGFFAYAPHNPHHEPF